jgi:hypothetical protein
MDISLMCCLDSQSGERFNVGRFIWVELAYVMDDGRRSLPYAPYLMFMIKRFSGQRFPNDCIHGVYNIKKTHGGKGSSGAAAGSPTRETSFAHRDVPESSRSGRKKKSKKLGKMSEWIKAIFATCTYAANTAYEDRLENREAVRVARELAGLPPLSPVRPPPQFPNLPSLSDTSSEDEQPHGDAQEQHFEQPDGDDSDDEGIWAAKEDPQVQETLLRVYSRRPRDPSEAAGPSSLAPPRRSLHLDHSCSGTC